MKKSNIYLSSTASSQDNIKDIVIELFQWGFVDIELSGGNSFYEGIEEDLFKLGKIYGIHFLIHNYFPPLRKGFVMNIVSQDQAIKNDTFGIINNAVRMTKKFGNDLYTIHPGYSKSYLYERDGKFYNDHDSETRLEKQNSKEDFYRAMNLLLDLNIFKNNDMRIGVENLFPLPDEGIHSFLDSDEDIAEFLDYYKLNSRVGLLLDLGHLNVASNSLNFDKHKILEKIISDYPDRIFEIHISENDGDGDAHQISDPGSWQIDFLKQNKKIFQDIPIAMEWWRISNIMEAYRSFEELKEIFLLAC
jgi:sugar phosphate isomerase/epimerase